VILVSDSAAPAGSPPGAYTLAGTPVTLSADGTVRTAAGVLAGSALVLDEAVRRWASLTAASVPQALVAAGERPAAALGLSGALRRGARADLVLLDGAGRVERVMRAGRWVHGG